jgi:hypothetical protein
VGFFIGSIVQLDRIGRYERSDIGSNPIGITNMESNWLDEGLVLKTSNSEKSGLWVRVPHSLQKLLLMVMPLTI